MKVKVSLLLCLTMLLLFTQCSKDIDSYYDRPSWLEDPIYQELEANGNFKLYLQALDRTLHASVLKGAGLYTCYAPNDEAFTAWMKDKGYATVAAIPQQEVESLVSYSLVYNEIKADNLGAALVNKVWTPGIAYKYKTTYYPMLTREMYNGDSVWVFDSNNYGGYTYSTKSNMVGNYKYLPVFTKSFFNASSPQLTAADYLAFYPTSTWAADKGLGNVGPASIIGDQHLAENGTFYELNKIAEPIPNIYNVLKTDPDCAEIWKLINYKTAGSTAYYFKYFMTVDNLADQFKLIYPNKNIDKVYVRGVLGFGFDPVVERYNGEGSSADVTQEGGVTMFVPSNAAVSSFVKNKLMKYYTDFDQVPVVAVTAFLASQCCQSLVWPSYFNKKKNLLNEYLSGLSNGPDIDAFGVTGKIMASNGMVYKSDKLIKSAYFESVFSEIFLNPQYNFTYKTYNLYYSGESSLTAMLLRCPLNGYMGEKNTLLLFSDQKLKNDGFYYNDVDMVFNHKTLTASGAAARIKRLTNNHVFLGYSDTITIGVPFGTNWGSTANTGRYLTKNTGANLTAADFTREGISSYDKWQFRVTNNGEMVRFKNNKIQAAGNIEDGTYASIAPADGDFNNGQVFTVDRMLDYAPRETGSGDAAYQDKTLWYYLDKARKENPDVSMFVDLVDSVMRNEDNGLTGIKSSNFYTVLMPNNTAMKKAIDAKIFPNGLLTTANYAEQEPNGAANALRFLLSHFLVGKVIPDDNLPIIYPYSPLSDDPACQVIPTALAISSDALGLTNEKTQVVAYKYRASEASTSYTLRFYAKNIVRGNTMLVKGQPSLSDGTNNHLQVSRTKITGATGYTTTRSNRIGCCCVLHEVNNYFNFIDQ